MAMPVHVTRFGVGLTLSVLGLAGAVVGIYWDPINGRDLATEGIGAMQASMAAGAAAMCVLGAVLLVMPRREPTRAKAERPASKSATAGRRQGPLKKKAGAGGKCRLNKTKRQQPR